MSFPTFPFLRFHVLRMLRLQPIAVSVLALCVALAIIAAVSLLAQANRARAAQALLTELRDKTVPVRAQTPVTSLAAPDLPPFDSALLVSVLNETATDSGLVLDEVVYTLDNNSNQPYMRYRITMSLNATYPLIRRLAEQLNTNVPHLTLDAINCSRKDVVVAELNCDMVMSGFFRKDARG